MIQFLSKGIASSMVDESNQWFESIVYLLLKALHYFPHSERRKSSITSTASALPLYVCSGVDNHSVYSTSMMMRQTKIPQDEIPFTLLSRVKTTSPSLERVEFLCNMFGPDILDSCLFMWSWSERLFVCVYTHLGHSLTNISLEYHIGTQLVQDHW